MKNFNEMTVKELRAEAKANGIKGFGHMTKAEIVAALEAATKVEEPAPAEVEVIAPAEDAKPVEVKVYKAEKLPVKATTKVVLLAFTGMKIAEFEAELKDGEYIVIAKNGNELHFDKNGKQLNAKNPKFGNKITFVA